MQVNQNLHAFIFLQSLYSKYSFASKFNYQSSAQAVSGRVIEAGGKG